MFEMRNIIFNELKIFSNLKNFSIYIQNIILQNLKSISNI